MVLLLGVGVAQGGCGSKSQGFGDDGGGLPSLGGLGGDGSLLGAMPTASSVLAVVRDFRLYDPNDPSTDPDFENPPNAPHPWDDHEIVSATLGADGKPVYKHPGATTLTTHGQASFDKWYRDVPGTNIHVDYPLPITHNADGSYGYDSLVSGVAYNNGVDQGNGFFPIDDGSPYATPFGNQGKPHNYSFTMEIHTVFTYRGGEFFRFRGDDDVFVFVNGALVIDLGGIHSPESAQVSIDTLGLTPGHSYPLDFFSAERHVTGSNILFETTLNLQAPPR
jgi:fibro-slime domain-containing protein